MKTTTTARAAAQAAQAAQTGGTPDTALAVAMIGAIPKPGPLADAQIAAVLGQPGSPAPCYHRDAALAEAAMDAIGHVGYVCQSGKAGYVCFVTADGGWAVTPNYPTPTLALASALHYAACVAQSALT